MSDKANVYFFTHSGEEVTIQPSLFLPGVFHVTSKTTGKSWTETGVHIQSYLKLGILSRGVKHEN